MLMQNFGGQIRCIVGVVQVANLWFWRQICAILRRSVVVVVFVLFCKISFPMVDILSCSDLLVHVLRHLVLHSFEISLFLEKSV